MAMLCILASCQTNSRIAYLTNRDGNFDIYLTDEKGENHTALTSNPGWDWYPKWNNSLKGIIYNSNDTLKNFSIRLMSDAGRSMQLDTDGLEEYILSPDGKTVLYTVSEGDDKYIYNLDLSTKEKKPLIKYPAYNGRPIWSPDGTRISFITDRDGNNEIYLYEIASGIETRLTNTFAREKYTSWTPDSQSIVFTASEEGRAYNDVYRAEVGTKVIERITDDEKLYEEIAVAPDGKQIAFHAQRDGQHHIFTMNIDGTNEQQITKVKAYHGEPEWIPGKN